MFCDTWTPCQKTLSNRIPLTQAVELLARWERIPQEPLFPKLQLELTDKGKKRKQQKEANKGKKKKPSRGKKPAGGSVADPCMVRQGCSGSSVLDKAETERPRGAPGWWESHWAVLEKIPQEAWPETEKHGEFSWTRRSGQARIEVLMTKKAYYLKSMAGGQEFPQGQVRVVTWGKFNGPVGAWAEAKRVVGF